MVMRVVPCLQSIDDAGLQLDCGNARVRLIAQSNGNAKMSYRNVFKDNSNGFASETYRMARSKETAPGVPEP
jgi:hypothetical protein